MANENFQFRQLQGLKAGQKDVTNTYTIRTGRPSDGFVIDNPVVIDGSGGAYTVTLPDGYQVGQMVMVVCETAGNTVTLAVTNHANTDSNPTASLDAAEQYLLLIWTGAEWDTVSYDGCSDVA